MGLNTKTTRWTTDQSLSGQSRGKWLLHNSFKMEEQRTRGLLQVCFQKSTEIWFESVLTLICSHTTGKVVLNLLSQSSGIQLVRKTQWVQTVQTEKEMS